MTEENNTKISLKDVGLIITALVAIIALAGLLILSNRIGNLESGLEGFGILCTSYNDSAVDYSTFSHCIPTDHDQFYMTCVNKDNSTFNVPCLWQSLSRKIVVDNV